MRKLNWTTIALIGGLLLLLLAVAYFATGRDAGQDKLTDGRRSSATAPSGEKLCADKTTYDLIKRELFRRAAQLRGSDQAAYDKLSAYASLRMENPVMESEDSTTHAVNCSGSLSVDLPPGVTAVGGRRSLMSDVDYVVQPAADDSGTVVLLRNADSIIAPLATLVRVAAPPPAAPAANEVAPEENVAAAESANAEPGPASIYPGRPSFDCARASSKGEIAVCSDSGLSALDVNMATQYRRAFASASPAERQLLRSTANRFYAYRDHCFDRQCIGAAYVDRMREIRDIVEGRWAPPR